MATFQYGANVQANGIRLHYLRYGGAGRPLVLLPGITSPAVTWGFVAETLGVHFRVYALDARGRGLSSAGPDLDYGLDAMADDVASFVDVLGLDAPILVGHSMGARIAIRAVSRRALQPHRLVLVDPPVSGPGRRPYPAQLAWYVDSIRMAVAGCSGEQLRQFFPSWTAAELNLRAEWLHTCLESAVVRSFNDFQDTDIHADLPHIAAPTLLVVAGQADVVRAADADEMAQLLKGLRVKTVAKGGHMIPWDDFDGFFEAILPFLTE